MRKLFLPLAAAIGIAICLSACGASAREKTINTTYNTLNVAAQSFVEWDGKHQLDIVSAATSHEDGVNKLSEYRSKRDKVKDALVSAYSALAAAAIVNDDPSLSSAIQAAVLVRNEFKALGVPLP